VNWNIFQKLGLFVLLALLLLSLPVQSQQSPQVLHRHVRPVVSSGQATLQGSLPLTQTMNLSIVLPLRNSAALNSLLSQIYDPSSPNYHRFLSVDEFTAQFGPTAEDYQTVVNFAKANGFTVTDQPANRLIVLLSGTVAQINTAFHVQMNNYRHPTEDRIFYSPDREPSLNLGVPVAHIVGLDNFSLPQPMVVQPQDSQPIANITGSGPGGTSYLGSDMRAAYYGGTTLTGTGQVVGLFEFGGYNQSDVDLTFSNAGQTYSVPIVNVLLDGATGAADSGSSEDVLDIVQAIGMAPGLSQVRVYIGVTNDATILNSMATENLAKQIGISWGWRPADPTTDDVFFEELAAQGQSVFVASGDHGAYDAAISPFFYPADDDYVTAVGGTHLTTNGAAGAWVSETVWDTTSQGTGSGGGISPDGIAIPSWQSGVATTANGGSTTLRNVPDVAMEGDYDNYTCVAGACDGGWAGTSFAAPRWAGFMALVNQQAVEAGTAPAGGIGFINPALYTLAEGSSYSSDLHDITSGNNDTANQPVWFSATTGYDLTTGWGSPTGQKLIDALAGPQVPGFWLAASAGALAITQGATATSTITVTDAGGFSGSVTLAVTSTLPTGVTASLGTNPTTGTSVLTLTASSSATAGTYTVAITGTSGTLTETTNIALTVHSPTFTLTPTSSSVALYPGTPSAATITVNSLYGFTGNVTLAASGLPTGVTASWGTNPTAGSSVLTLTAGTTAVGGTTTITITGTSGSLTQTTTISLTVCLPMFTLNTSSVNIGQGSIATTSVVVNDLYGFTGSVTLTVSGLPTGVTASFATNPTTSSSVLTFSSSSSTVAGNYPLTITGTSGTTTATTTLLLGVYAPTFTLTGGSTSVGQGASVVAYVDVNDLYGFTGSVTLSASGMPSGVTATWGTNPATSSSTLTFTSSTYTPAGQYTITISGTSGSLTATTTLTLYVRAPTFIIGPPFGLITLGQNGSVTAPIFVEPEYGFSGNVTLSASGLPSGVTASFSPNPTTGTSVLTLTASSTASAGATMVTITGTSGTTTATTTLFLTVNASTFTLTDAPSTMNLVPGGSGVSKITVVPQYGFADSVGMTISGLPSGVTAAWGTNPTTGTSVLTLTASRSAVAGTTTATITGTSGSLVATTPLSVVIKAESTTTTALAVTSSGAPVTSVAAGSAVTLSATVTAGSTTLTAGSVNFCDASATYCEDIHLLGTAQLTSAGKATLKFIPGIGSHSYKAVFTGTNGNASSASSASALTVTGAVATTTTIAQSGVVGNYSLTATVTATGPIAPTGGVSFLDTSNANFLLGSATLGAGSETLSWLTPQTYATGTTPTSFAVGDFNGDGIPDLAVANQSSNTVTILLGNGDGTFTPYAVSLGVCRS
jgi:hypothetical protein